jgi:glycosyltransferase involved in cell wall biosynthesis
MRIAHVLEPSTGGVPRHVRDLVAAQVTAGHDVAAIVSDRGDLPAGLRALGAHVTTAPLAPEITAAGADLRSLGSVARALRVRRPDVVHAHAPKAGVIGRLAARAAGAPVVYSPHCFAYLTQQVRQRRGVAVRRHLTLGIERALAPLARVIVCVSEWERERALADRVAPPGKLVVVPNGVEIPGHVEPDPRVVALRGSEPVVGFLSRFGEQKAPLDFLAAIERVSVPVRAVMVGEGPLEAEVRARAGDAALGGRVTVLPFDGNALATLASFDLLVLPSLWESLPIVLLEAMSVGLPVVATDVGGVREAVADGRTGILTAAGDSAGLVAAVERLAADDGLRGAMGAAARDRCHRHFRMDAMVRAIQDVYAAALS